MPARRPDYDTSETFQASAGPLHPIIFMAGYLTVLQDGGLEFYSAEALGNNKFFVRGETLRL
jgi:hypothetical protein